MGFFNFKFIPTKLTIEPCSICQLRCPTCHQTTGKKPKYGKGYLKFSNFRQIIEDNPQINFVEFQSEGEIFLNPEILEIIKYGYEKRITMSCAGGSNFNYVKDEVLEGLVKYQFFRIRCSIDGASNETYKQYRTLGNYDNVIKNIKILNEYKRKYKSNLPELTWGFIVFGHNEKEIPKARNLAKELNMKFDLRMSWDDDISPIRDVEFVKEQTGWQTVTRKDFEKATGDHYARSDCQYLWHRPIINWNGEVLGCSLNGWGDFVGNVFTDGYISVVNNSKINYARKMLLGKVKPREDIPCSSCNVYKKMQKEGHYFTLKEIKPQWYKSHPLFKILHFFYNMFGIRKIYKKHNDNN